MSTKLEATHFPHPWWGKDRSATLVRELLRAGRLAMSEARKPYDEDDRAALAARLMAPVYRALGAWIGPGHPDGTAYVRAATRAELASRPEGARPRRIPPPRP